MKKKIEMRQMTRKQIKELRSKGLDIATASEPSTSAGNAEMIDWILDNVYGDVPGLDDHEYGDLVRLAMETYRAAYGSKEEIKN